MQTIPEQISAATRAPIEAQLELFGSIAKATVENTGRFALLQIDASRAAVDQTCAAWRQLLTAGPQNLFELLSQAQSNLTGMLDSARSPFAFPQTQEPAEQGREASRGAMAAPPAPAPAMHGADYNVTSNAEYEAAPQAIPDPHAPQPPASRTPIAEAASQVAAEGQPGFSIAAAPIPEEAPASLPPVKPLEAVPPAPFHKQESGPRKGVPRK